MRCVDCGKSIQLGDPHETYGSNSERRCPECVANYDKLYMTIYGTSRGLPLVFRATPTGRYITNEIGSLAFKVARVSSAGMEFIGPDGCVWNGIVVPECDVIECHRNTDWGIK